MLVLRHIGVRRKLALSVTDWLSMARWFAVLEELVEQARAP
jgi:hypothetical protein